MQPVFEELAAEDAPSIRVKSEVVKRPRIRIDGVEYENLKQASIGTGLSYNGLRHHLRNNPDKDYKNHTIERVYMHG